MLWVRPSGGKDLQQPCVLGRGFWAWNLIPSASRRAASATSWPAQYLSVCCATSTSCWAVCYWFHLLVMLWSDAFAILTNNSNVFILHQRVIWVIGMSWHVLKWSPGWRTHLTTVCFSCLVLITARHTPLYIYRLVTISLVLSLFYRRNFWSISRCSGCFTLYVLSTTICFRVFGVKAFVRSQLVTLQESFFGFLTLRAHY